MLDKETRELSELYQALDDFIGGAVWSALKQQMSEWYNESFREGVAAKDLVEKGVCMERMEVYSDCIALPERLAAEIKEQIKQNKGDTNATNE